MDKLLTFPGKTEKGIFTFVIDTERSFLEKTAAEYHPEIAAYINSAKTIPGKTQVLLTALGAYEFWGNNANGDAFPESALANSGDDYGHKTFEKYAKIYKHHVNKDPTASYGDVLLSVYNYRYHRVELIVCIDNQKAPDLAEKINSGDYFDWSMGTRVPFDVCSICGNRAPTRKEYCEHLKYYLGRIHPETGKLAVAINTYPKFFDISAVLIGADRTAKTLLKVAKHGGAAVTSSALIAEKMAETKSATIEKEVPASNEPPASQDAVNTLVQAIPEIKAQEPPMPAELLNRLGELKLPEVFSTMAMLGIVPKPQEFQRIILISIGKRDIADQLDSKNMCFDPASVEDPLPAHIKILNLSSDNFNPQIMNMLSPHVEDRSYAMPHLTRRIVLTVKQASKEYLPNFIKISKEDRKPVGIVPLMMLAAGMYAAFGKKAPEEAIGGIDKLIAKHPGLAAALAASVPMIFNQVAGTRVKGQYDANEMLENPDSSHILERIEEQKQKPYLKVAGAIGPASKRLFLGIPAVYMASGVLQKHRQANPYDQENRVRSFIRKNPDIIGAALAVDAMLALQGKGSHKVTKHLAPVANAFWSNAKKLTGIKTASAQDFVSNALVWPLAFGGRGLPGRVVGGLFDQAILESSKKVLSNKDKNNKLLATDRRD